MKKEKISEKQLKEFLFGWLWVEENIMQSVRKEPKQRQEGKKVIEMHCPHCSSVVGLNDNCVWCKKFNELLKDTEKHEIPRKS